MADLMTAALSSTTSDRVISQEATFTVDLPVQEAFLLFDPLAEKKWVTGWNPDFIFPTDGQIREKMVFLTKPRFEGEPKYQWIVMKYDPTNHVVVYSVSTQERIWFVEVRCSVWDNISKATVRYTYVALTNHGAQKNEMALQQMFADNLVDWQDAIHKFLGKTND